MAEYLDIKTPARLANMILLFFITTIFSTVFFGIIPILNHNQYVDDVDVVKPTNIYDFEVYSNIVLSISVSLVFFLIISTWLVISYIKNNLNKEHQK